MTTEDSGYFSRLKDRGRFRSFLRRMFLGPVVDFFEGRVLDVGAGAGVFLELYRNSVGVDSDPQSAAYCTEKGFDCVVGDVCALPFAGGAFDGVLLNNVLEHLERPEAAVEEVFRVLREGGRLFIEVPGKKGFLYDKTHVRFWDLSSLEKFLDSRGFEVTSSGYFPVPFCRAGDFLTHNKLRVGAVRRPAGDSRARILR